MCVRVADDLDLYRLLAEKPRTAQELAQLSGAQEELILRLMRVLVATGFAAQAGHHRYDALPATRNMTLSSVRAGVRLKYFQPFTYFCLSRSSFLLTDHQRTVSKKIPKSALRRLPILRRMGTVSRNP